jgi:hypothetical protein
VANGRLGVQITGLGPGTTPDYGLNLAGDIASDQSMLRKSLDRARATCRSAGKVVMRLVSSGECVNRLATKIATNRGACSAQGMVFFADDIGITGSRDTPELDARFVWMPCPSYQGRDL